MDTVIEFRDVVLEGASTVAITTDSPSSDGFEAGRGALGITPSGKLWVKYGVSDTDWLEILSADVSQSNFRVVGSVLQFRDYDDSNNFLGWRPCYFRNGAMSQGELVPD